MVCQENIFVPIILHQIYSWKILIMSNFMFLQGGGTPQFVILQAGWRNIWMMYYMKKTFCIQAFCFIYIAEKSSN